MELALGELRLLTAPAVNLAVTVDHGGTRDAHLRLGFRLLQELHGYAGRQPGRLLRAKQRLDLTLTPIEQPVAVDRVNSNFHVLGWGWL